MGVRVLILKGDGINCEKELGNAFLSAGGEITYLHINDLLSEPERLQDFQVLGLPGGFSFGDEIRSGKVLATKLKFSLGEELQKFIGDQKLILGICNGFQALVQLNAFESFEAIKPYTLAENDHGEFRNFWTKVLINKNYSPWLNSIEGEIYLPVRHKEGRLIGEVKQEQKVIFYDENINGSIDQIAGITNLTGNVLGMMPHPEAALNSYLYPFNESEQILIENNLTKVKQIFINAIKYSMERQ